MDAHQGGRELRDSAVAKLKAVEDAVTAAGRSPAPADANLSAAIAGWAASHC
jgi:hypothetical protein